jgi:hypothetical protein
MTITVQFTGICTHVKTLGGRNHRVVLVRADHGAFLNDAPIPPHIAKLKIHPDDIVSIEGYPYGLQPLGAPGVWQLCGVHLTLEGTKDKPIQRDSSFDKVPRLSMSGDSPIPSISNEVTTRGQAACYVDLDKGILTADKPKSGAVTTTLTVGTTRSPALRVKAFWNQKSSLITLKPGAAIAIEHTGYEQGDTEKDFLMHYRIFEWVHPDAKIPPKAMRAVSRIPGDISVGCSNSQYP